MNDKASNLLDPAGVVNKKTNLAMHTQSATGFAMPPIVPWKTVVRVKGKADVALGRDIDNEVQWGLQNLASTMFQVPVWLRLDSEPADGGFLLPVDPLVAISGSNVIARRYVSASRMRGSIKETWSQDDYSVTISGIIMDNEFGTMEQYVRRLRTYCEAREAIHITCEFINEVFGITRLAIENYDFPFTRGEESQQFTIKAYSDDAYALLEDV